MSAPRRSRATSARRRKNERKLALLLDQEKEARSEAEALAESARALAENLDLEKTVQKATDLATQVSGAKFGTFFYNVVNDREESYTLYTISGVPREAFSKFPMPRITAIFGPTFRGEGIVRLADVCADPHYGHNAPHHGMPEGHLPVRSYLAVPVRGRTGTVPEAQRDGAKVHVHPPLPTVLAHEAYLSQVFTNLIGNAVKFAAAGRPAVIDIRAVAREREVTVSIADNGIGIAPENFDRIFEIFGRVYPDKKYEGTGIGLAIVKKAVQRMRGQVSVQSTVGAGTCFSFTLSSP